MRRRRAAEPPYSPARVDSRVAEAAAMLSARTKLDGLTPNGLRSQFNLRIETAEKLIRIEQGRRG